ncbi:HLA class II histocompatibility antigen gamma chain isoform X1 [Sphaerodactylus townsendi]|uniref:HLA class II histocompatibility antigen gamma chain isoform X1 n=1 Tax=Sphaerodactylus townsendi TaxID=933632 RepID=UPI002027526D|nr:HLA class II histocompatibility antigen gamma chain isoform X1 [Sphaerodactylus townsendi]
MENDRRTLLANQQQPTETAVYAGTVEHQQRLPSNNRVAYSVFTILAVLLIAGQALTAYFVYQHQNQISKLTKNTNDLQLKAMVSSLPHEPKPAGRMRMPMANMMPLLMRDTDSNAEDPTQLSNKTEDIVKRLLLMGDPTRKFPKLEKAFMDNMIQLKRSMNYVDWNAFEMWMYKWLLFQMAQTKDPEEIAAVKVQTKCQAEASFKGVYPGKFRPQCDENGDYLPVQCNHSTGFCWCAKKDGTKIEGTSSRGFLNCTETHQIVDPENATYSGQDLLHLN